MSEFIKFSWPPFKDKLEIREGIVDIKSEFYADVELREKCYSWKFCEHDQVIFQMSMAQSITGWKKRVQNNYPNQFPNFENFIPVYNDVSFHNYDKAETVKEIQKLKTFEESHERLDQFIDLLEKAIALNQNIYW